MEKKRDRHRPHEDRDRDDRKKSREKEDRARARSARQKEEAKLVEKVRSKYPGYDDEYKLLKEIGDGGYGKVYTATYFPLGEKKLFAVKQITKDANEFAVAKEIEMLERVRGHPNIIKLRDVRKSEKTRRLSLLVFDHIKSPKYTSIYPFLSSEEIQTYMKQIISAVAHMHKRNIVHCDIKPRNILIDRTKHKAYLIDLGQAHEMKPGKDFSPHIGTMVFRSPEILLKYKRYDGAIDIWCLGMTFLYMLAPTVRKHFKLEDKTGQSSNSKRDQNKALENIARIFGSEPIMTLAQKLSYPYNIKFVSTFPKRKLSDWLLNYYLSESYEKEKKLPPVVLDLVSKMLRIHPEKRISASEALRHPYFKMKFIETPDKIVTEKAQTEEKPRAKRENKGRKAPAAREARQ